MKKLIKKWLGITDLKERANYNEALAKSNKQDIDNMMEYYIRPLRSEFETNFKRVSENSVAIEILKDTLDIDKPNKAAPKKNAKKTPPKKVTKK